MRPPLRATRFSDMRDDLPGVSDVAKDEKAQAKKEQAKGKAKEALGRAVGNEQKTAEGRTEAGKGDLRQAKEKAKDAFKR